MNRNRKKEARQLDVNSANKSNVRQGTGVDNNYRPMPIRGNNYQPMMGFQIANANGTLRPVDSPHKVQVLDPSLARQGPHLTTHSVTQNQPQSVINLHPQVVNTLPQVVNPLPQVVNTLPQVVNPLPQVVDTSSQVIKPPSPVVNTISQVVIPSSQDTDTDNFREPFGFSKIPETPLVATPVASLRNFNKLDNYLDDYMDEPHVLLAHNVSKTTKSSLLAQYQIAGSKGWQRIFGYVRGTDVQPIQMLSSGNLYGLSFSHSGVGSLSSGSLYIYRNITGIQGYIPSRESESIVSIIHIKSEITKPTNITVKPGEDTEYISWEVKSIELERNDHISIYAENLSGTNIGLYIEYN